MLLLCTSYTFFKILYGVENKMSRHLQRVLRFPKQTLFEYLPLEDRPAVCLNGTFVVCFLPHPVIQINFSTLKSE